VSDTAECPTKFPLALLKPNASTVALNIFLDCEKREKTIKKQQSDVYYQHCLNMFRASLCPSSGEQRPCDTACGVLCWFCWMWLVVVVGRCVVGCSHCEGYCSTFTVLAPYNAVPHNHYQPHWAEPAQHTTCSNTRSLFSWRWGIMMPETCWDSVDNKHIIVASCWFSLSLHNLLTMHGHRNLKLKYFWMISCITVELKHNYVNIATHWWRKNKSLNVGFNSNTTWLVTWWYLLAFPCCKTFISYSTTDNSESLKLQSSK